ncbi:MAG: hypothetical protein U0822_14790 [Anaerolineae bacterium]
MTLLSPTTRASHLAAWAWIAQAATGVLLLVLLTLHLAAQHFTGADGVLSYTEVIDYLRNPLVFLVETLFSASVLLHALLGVRAVLFDLDLSALRQHQVNIGLTILGVAMFLWAFALTFATVMR